MYVMNVGGYHGPPELAVEVLSPSTSRHDKTVKFLLYEKSGVREYWIVDPDHQQMEVWQLTDGEYELFGIFRTDDTFNSPALGSQTIDLNSLSHRFRPSLNYDGSASSMKAITSALNCAKDPV